MELKNAHIVICLEDEGLGLGKSHRIYTIKNIIRRRYIIVPMSIWNKNFLIMFNVDVPIGLQNDNIIIIFRKYITEAPTLSKKPVNT